MRKNANIAVVKVGFVLALTAGAVATIGTLTTHPSKAPTAVTIQAVGADSPTPTATTSASPDNTVWG
jgi:hypothetical protein